MCSLKFQEKRKHKSGAKQPALGNKSRKKELEDKQQNTKKMQKKQVTVITEKTITDKGGKSFNIPKNWDKNRLVASSQIIHGIFMFSFNFQPSSSKQL